MKLGKKSAVVPANSIPYKDFAINPSNVPVRCDNTFGFSTWPVWGNDSIGDCTIASAFNIIEQQFRSQGKTSPYNATDAIETYSAVTGYSEAVPQSDQGAVCSSVLAKWATDSFPLTEMVPAQNRQKISAYSYINPLDILSIKHAINELGSVYVGIQLPLSAQTQTNEWFVTGGPGSQPGSWGGHCIILVGFTKSLFVGITWGKLILITLDWWEMYGDEAWAVLDKNFLNPETKRTFSGLDSQGLISAFQSV